MVVGLALAVVASLGLGAAIALGGRSGPGIDTYTAPTISVYTGTTAKPPPKCRTPAVKRSYFFGTWATWVQGTTWDGGDYRWFSTGANGRAVAIHAGGTWTWHGKSGKWRTTGDRSYPLVLLNAVGGHNWKVGLACPHEGVGVHAKIVLWDGNTWYWGGKR